MILKDTVQVRVNVNVGMSSDLPSLRISFAEIQASTFFAEQLRRSIRGSGWRLLALDDADDALVDDPNCSAQSRHILNVVLEAFERGGLHVVIATSLRIDQLSTKVLSRLESL